VREVWGSTRGTPKPCRWFLEFVEWQALRCYRMVVLGWTPLSQKPIPRPVAQKTIISLSKNSLGTQKFLSARGESLWLLCNLSAFEFPWHHRATDGRDVLARLFLVVVSKTTTKEERSWLVHASAPLWASGSLPVEKTFTLQIESPLKRSQHPVASTARSTWKIHEIFLFPRQHQKRFLLIR